MIPRVASSSVLAIGVIAIAVFASAREKQSVLSRETEKVVRAASAGNDKQVRTLLVRQAAAPDALLIATLAGRVCDAVRTQRVDHYTSEPRLDIECEDGQTRDGYIVIAWASNGDRDRPVAEFQWVEVNHAWRLVAVERRDDTTAEMSRR